MEPLKRRALLLEHAARLFGEKGYHNTSISDIITSADVARGTFYLYFPNKRKLFEELIDGLLLRISSCIETIKIDHKAPSARKQLTDNLFRVFALLSQEQHMLFILLHGAVSLDGEIDEKLADFYLKVNKTLEKSLITGQKMGLVRNCNTSIAAAAALGAIKQLLQSAMKEPGWNSHQDIKDKVSELLDIFSLGVLHEGVKIP